MIASNPISRFCKAFSLIEVTLSLAIVAFALLTIMALMPTGIKMMTDSSRDEVTANIVTQLRGQIQQLPFVANANVGDTTTITSLQSMTQYYDSTGENIPTTGNNPPPNTTVGPLYKVTFSINAAAGGNFNSAANGKGFVLESDSVGMGTNNVAKVTIYVIFPWSATSVPYANPMSYGTVIYVAKQVGS